MSWGYRSYWPKRKPRRKVEGGIKARSKRGAIGETWWSQRWIDLLESFGMGPRLNRGRTYARQGQVMSIDVQPGIVSALVQGSRSRPYSITIRLKPLSAKDWEKVTDAMVTRAVFAAKLLAGEMPQNIEEAFTEVKRPLFPEQERDLQTDCSCPDWANPCKHIAAVLYILAEQFDEDPFLIFKLRGCTRDEIIETLRRKRVAAAPVEAAPDAPVADAHEEVKPLEECLADFWRWTPDPSPTRGFRPEVEQAAVKRLGPAPFDAGGRSLTDWLTEVYTAASRAARDRAGRD